MKRLENHKTMRIIYVFLLYLVATGVSLAQNVKSIVLYDNDGKEVSILLSDNPVITFSETDPTEMTVTTDKTAIKLSTSSLDVMKTEDKSVVSVKDIISDGEMSFDKSGDALIFSVSSGTADVSVYKVDGSKVLSRTLTAGQTVLPMSALPQGTLIVKFNSQTLKIYKR